MNHSVQTYYPQAWRKAVAGDVVRYTGNSIYWRKVGDLLDVTDSKGETLATGTITATGETAAGSPYVDVLVY